MTTNIGTDHYQLCFPPHSNVGCYCDWHMPLSNNDHNIYSTSNIYQCHAQTLTTTIITTVDVITIQLGWPHHWRTIDHDDNHMMMVNILCCQMCLTHIGTICSICIPTTSWCRYAKWDCDPNCSYSPAIHLSSYLCTVPMKPTCLCSSYQSESHHKSETLQSVLASNQEWDLVLSQTSMTNNVKVCTVEYALLGSILETCKSTLLCRQI